MKLTPSASFLNYILILDNITPLYLNTILSPNI